MFRLIFFALCLVVLFYAARRFLAGQKPTVSVTSQNVSVRGWQTGSSVNWSDVRQIDVARTLDAGADRFSVVLFGNYSLAICSDYRGFDQFAAEMFNRWPAIRQEWMRVFGGPPNISERVTVWKQDGG
jgi:hypothetical protein